MVMRLDGQRQTEDRESTIDLGEGGGKEERKGEPTPGAAIRSTSRYYINSVSSKSHLT